MTTTSEVIELSIFVEAADWLTKFDAIEVLRSRFSSGGPYESLTGDGWSTARLPATVAGEPPDPAVAGPSVPIGDLTLELLIDEETTVLITFESSSPQTYGEAAEQITAQGQGLVRAFVIGSHLVVETTQPGASAVLRVVGGEAAPLLGLSTEEPQSLAFGKDARIPLRSGVTQYFFTDVNGNKDYSYVTRLYNTTTRGAGSFDIPSRGRGFVGVTGAQRVLGVVDLVDMRGVAKKNQEVLVYLRTAGTIVEGKLVVPSAPYRLLSDEDGHVEFTLVRGSQVTVAIAGTDIVHDIDVPTDPAVTTFNLLDPNVGSNDLFRVQVPDINYAVRRTL